MNLLIVISETASRYWNKLLGNIFYFFYVMKIFTAVTTVDVVRWAMRSFLGINRVINPSWVFKEPNSSGWGDSWWNNYSNLFGFRRRGFEHESPQLPTGSFLLISLNICWITGFMREDDEKKNFEVTVCFGGCFNYNEESNIKRNWR